MAIVLLIGCADGARTQPIPLDQGSGGGAPAAGSGAGVAAVVGGAASVAGTPGEGFSGAGGAVASPSTGGSPSAAGRGGVGAAVGEGVAGSSAGGIGAGAGGSGAPGAGGGFGAAGASGAGAGFGAAGASGASGGTAGETGFVGTGTFTQVAAYLLGRCATSTACHGNNAREVVLRGDALYSTLMSKTVAECRDEPLVTPSDPSRSALYNVLARGCGEFLMPPACTPGPCGTLADRQMIETWIASGAPEN